MSQTVAFVLPLPVAFALVFLLLVLVVLSAVALSLRAPSADIRREPAAGEEIGDDTAFRLGRLQIDGVQDAAGQQRRAR